MSSKMLPPSIPSQSPGFYTAATLPRYFDFMQLPLEVLIILLGHMAAEQLPLFRCLCRAFHNFVAKHQSLIVTAALRNGRYRTASMLYYPHIFHPRPPPITLHVNDLYLLACRYDSAHKLALLLAELHVIDLIRASPHSGIAPDKECSITQVADNVYPYVICLFHFMESYRSALANFVPDPMYAYSYLDASRRPSSQIERQLLAQYSNLTVHRLCFLYDRLLEIVKQKIPQKNLACLPRQRDLPIPSSHLDIFIFGGLEAFRDVIVKSSTQIRVDQLRAHYDKSAGTTYSSLRYTIDFRHYISSVILPKPILPWLDVQTTHHLCRRLPYATNLLHPWTTGIWALPPNFSRDVEEGRFLGYLATHDGVEPKLLQ